MSDAVVILIVVLLNALIGAAQEGRPSARSRASGASPVSRARVLRGGREEVLPAADLVPGDIILVGRRRDPADACLIEVAGLQLAEAALTGESLPARKEARPLPGDTLLADVSDVGHPCR